MDERVQDSGETFSQDLAETPEPLEAECGAETEEWPQADGGPAGAPADAGSGPAVRGRLDGPHYKDFREFMEIFPEAARDTRLIPPEVWAEVRQGRSLVGAYARYSGGRARAEALRFQTAAQQNAAGAAGSTGSMRSAESGLGGRDAFLQGFLE